MTTVDQHIVKWLKDYCYEYNKSGFIIGISGGVDSALTSTLCSMTGLSTLGLILPINSTFNELALKHVNWLETTFSNFKYDVIDLSNCFESFDIPDTQWLVRANTKSRIRMIELYANAQYNNLLVCGTGNKVEDYGVGFFTKYGDGGVDISPIGNLTKTEVWELAKHLGVSQEIIDAEPTDGLWEDGRSDVSQLGCSYPDLEWAMDLFDKNSPDSLFHSINCGVYTDQQSFILKKYWELHTKNAHKMQMPPICPPFEE